MLIESEKCKNILKFNLFEKWFKLNVYIVLMENIIILYFNWWVFFFFINCLVRLLVILLNKKFDMM